MTPPIVFGAGAFNTQYDQEPELGDAATVLKHAFARGITAIDTAAAYGPSEGIVGEALQRIGQPRDSYQLCTKCCRWETDEFIFSRDSVLRSFKRSLSRLRTDYVDVLYIHDVEFGAPEDVLEAVATAFELKDDGKVREVGISGYPLPVLVAAAHLVKSRLGRPLDRVLSYCNLTLQNDLLLEFRPKLLVAGVKTVLNASPLSMSMLRSRPTHTFHQGQKELHKVADSIGQQLLAKNIELADAAVQYSFAQWQGDTVIGLRTTAEIDAAINNLQKAVESPNTDLWDQIKADFGEWHNATWEEEGSKKFKAQWEQLGEQ